MTNGASLTMPHPESSFLRFGTWSVLLHVGVIVLLSFLHFSHTVEKPMPLVKVTLVEAQAPPKEAEPPPLLQPQRTQRPLQPQRIVPPPQQIPLPAEPPRVAEITPQPPPQSPPVKRRLLQDERASDALKLKNFTKVARSNFPTTSTKTNEPDTWMAIPALSAIAALEGISTKVPTLSSSSSVASDARAKTLRSVPTSQGPLKRGVGLKRRTELIYPRIAKTEGWEGTVLLLVVVQPDGRPDAITVERSSGHKVLDHAAIDTVERWTFYPAKDGNIPIRSTIKIPIKFVLRTQG